MNIEFRRRKMKKRLPGKSDPHEIYEMFKRSIESRFPDDVFEDAVCTKLNGGYICEARKYFRAYDCRRTTPKGPPKCVLDADGMRFDRDSAYLAWVSVYPIREGYGSKFYSDLEKYLRDYHNVRRITLHAERDAIPFWEKMGYEELSEPERISDLLWWNYYTRLPRYRKYLSLPRIKKKPKKYYPLKDFTKMVKEIPGFHPLQNNFNKPV